MFGLAMYKSWIRQSSSMSARPAAVAGSMGAPASWNLSSRYERITFDSNTHLPSLRMRAGTFFSGLICANSSLCRSGYWTIVVFTRPLMPPGRLRASHRRTRAALLLWIISKNIGGVSSLAPVPTTLRYRLHVRTRLRSCCGTVTKLIAVRRRRRMAWQPRERQSCSAGARRSMMIDRQIAVSG